jgi:hypothetical protein
MMYENVKRLFDIHMYVYKQHLFSSTFDIHSYLKYLFLFNNKSSILLRSNNVYRDYSIRTICLSIDLMKLEKSFVHALIRLYL